MPKTLDPVNFGTVTPVRRIRSLTIQTFWDDSTSPPETRLAATYEFEVIYTDSDGNQIVSPKHDGYVSLSDAQLRAMPNFMSAFNTISAAGDTVKDQQTPVVEPTPG
jgi:hypothetical protein